MKTKKVSLIFFLVAISFIILMAILFTPTPAPAHPTIAWTPDEVEITLSQGAEKNLTVSFSSNKDLKNIEIWVVPELQPYLTISPADLKTIEKDTLYTLTLSFSIPLDTPRDSDDDHHGDDHDNDHDDDDIEDTYEGTIHIRNTEKKDKTHSKPLPITLEITSPEKTLSEVASALRRGDIEAALAKIEPTSKNRELFLLLPPEDLKGLANWFENANLIKTTPAYKVYKTEFIDNNGKMQSVDFIMFQDSEGEWIIGGL